MDADKSRFRRVIRGLNTLSNGLKEAGQDRLHQFVRSLEALILPDIGRTEKQFVHRCQTFARAGDDTRDLLVEASAIRSDTEHLHPWDEAVQSYPADQRDDVCWHRTRQIEHLACDAYSRLLRDAALRHHFETDTAIAAFWKYHRPVQKMIAGSNCRHLNAAGRDLHTGTTVSDLYAGFATHPSNMLVAARCM